MKKVLIALVVSLGLSSLCCYASPDAAATNVKHHTDGTTTYDMPDGLHCMEKIQSTMKIIVCEKSVNVKARAGKETTH